MKGVQFVVNENGEKTAVVINLKQYSVLGEDFYDSAVAEIAKERTARVACIGQEAANRTRKASPAWIDMSLSLHKFRPVQGT